MTARIVLEQRGSGAGAAGDHVAQPPTCRRAQLAQALVERGRRSGTRTWVTTVPSGSARTPANLFVAGFIGSPAMNLLAADVRDGRVLLGGHEVPVAPEVRAALPGGAGAVTVCVRAEAWDLVGAAEHGIDVRIDLVEELGADGFGYGTADLGAAGTTPVTVRLPARGHLRAGEVIRVAAAATGVHLFDTASGGRIGA